MYGSASRQLWIALPFWFAFGSVQAADPVPLARSISDPLAPHDRVGLLLDWDRQIGGYDEGNRQTLTLLPAFSFDLDGGGRWVWQSRLAALRQQGYPLAGASDPDTSGLADLEQTLLYVPASRRDRTFAWGAGLAVRLPTATRDQLGQDDAALGPAVAVRWHRSRWSTGVQLQHYQAVGGDDDEGDLTRVQPFVARDLGRAWGLCVDVDATYDSDRDSLKGPLTLYARRAFAQGAGGGWAFEAGARYWPDGPTEEPEWGLRLGITWVLD